MEHRVVSDVVYLYGFVPADAPAPPDDLRGLGDAPVTLVDAGSVRAAVSHLDDAAFGADEIEQHLNDLAWVSVQGLAHERVVAWFVDHADILPARLFSLHSAESALRASVAATSATLAERLRAFAGRREWNLKVAYDPEVLLAHAGVISPALSDLESEIAAAAPGRRYLLERRRSDLAKLELRRAAQRLADELLAALSSHAVEARVLPLSQDVGTGTVVLSAALLVERSADERLRREADFAIGKLTPLGILVTFSGPWAPYRFVDSGVDA
jgi:hypothetical protein